MPLRILTLAGALLAIAAADPAAADTRNFGVSGFDRVRVEGPYAVKVATGIAPFARATGSSAALANLSVRVEGRTLVIHSDRSSARSADGRGDGPVEVSIGTHDLAAAILLGSGSLAIDKVRGLEFSLTVQGSGMAGIGFVAADRLKVAATGTAAVVLGGETKALTAMVRGVSSLDASLLKSRTATIAVEGAATVKADASGTAKISGSGPATVSLTGRPSCTVRLAGAGSVTGCR